MFQFRSDYSHLSPHKRFLARLRDTVVSRLGGVTRYHHDTTLLGMWERDRVAVERAARDREAFEAEVKFLRAELEQAAEDETKYKKAYFDASTALRVMEEEWEKEFYERQQAERKCRELQARIDAAKRTLDESLKRDRLTGEV